MSYFFGDSFDLYATTADMPAGYWDAASTNMGNFALVAGRFGGSRALQVANVNPTLIKTNVGGVDAVHHFFLAWMQSSAPSGATYGVYITLFDGTTAQCTVTFRTDGAIVLSAGGPSGSPTVLSTYNGAVTTANIWYAFEIEVTVHNTAGTFKVWKNGNNNPDWSVTGLNTRASANNYANKIQIGMAANTFTNNQIDDFLWRSDPSSVPWAGDIRCYTRHPASDVLPNPNAFSRTTSAVNAVMWSPVNVQQNFGNNAVYMQFISSYSGLLTGVTFGPNSNGGTGHIKAALFSSIGNTIGSVLAVTSEVTNPPLGVTLSFPTPYLMTAGQTYWIGEMCDPGHSIQLNAGGSPPNLVYGTAVSYASWPVSNPTGTYNPGNAIGLTLIFTPQSNSDSVGELQQDLTVNYVYSSTPGQNDLYTIGSIGAVPAQILGVVTRGFFEKSDAGTRNASVQLKSGGTTVQGPDTALTTAVWNWITRTDLVDPATSATWTATAVNAVTIGPKITA